MLVVKPDGVRICAHKLTADSFPMLVGAVDDSKDGASNRQTERYMPVDPTYLREQAQRCVRLARVCPHLPTAHELEAMGVEFMEQAAELDNALIIPPPTTDTAG
jgi:hypothetical protein